MSQGWAHLKQWLQNHMWRGETPSNDRADEFSEIAGQGEMHLYCLADENHLGKAAWWQFSPLAEQGGRTDLQDVPLIW